MGSGIYLKIKCRFDDPNEHAFGKGHITVSNFEDNKEMDHTPLSQDAVQVAWDQSPRRRIEEIHKLKFDERENFEYDNLKYRNKFKVR